MSTSWVPPPIMIKSGALFQVSYKVKSKELTAVPRECFHLTLTPIFIFKVCISTVDLETPPAMRRMQFYPLNRCTFG